MKNGCIEGCAACCACCTDRKKCNYVCAYGLHMRLQEKEQSASQLELEQKDVVSKELLNPVQDNVLRVVELGAIKQKLSAYGTSKRVYPDDDSFDVVGCEGDHDCFDCSLDCDIRQKNCYCREAPLASPFDCTTMHVFEKLKLEIGDKCQFVNRDLAKYIVNGKLASDCYTSACCKRCRNTDCGYRCNRSVHQNYEVESTGDVVQTVEYQEVQQPEEVKQSELPVLKNNDQRKDFIDAYKSWPVWIDQQLTGEKYYRYDLTDKVAIVVKVSRKHAWKDYKESNDFEYAAEQYYLLGIKTTWSSKGTKIVEDESRTFYECDTNKTALVDYLKEFQKK